MGTEKENAQVFAEAAKNTGIGIFALLASLVSMLFSIGFLVLQLAFFGIIVWIGWIAVKAIFYAIF